MQLDKLKKLNDAISKLDKGIKEERREQKQSGELAKQSVSDPKALTTPKEISSKIERPPTRSPNR